MKFFPKIIKKKRSKRPTLFFGVSRSFRPFPDNSRLFQKISEDYLRTLFISLRKQTTFREVTNGFPAKWRLRNERGNSILMTRHYPDLGSASDYSCRSWNLLQPIRSNTQIWVVRRHQYGISALVSQTSFRGKTVGDVEMSSVFSGYLECSFARASNSLTSAPRCHSLRKFLKK